jgi:protein-disulfide isomerase-like protein with CxxC motif
MHVMAIEVTYFSDPGCPWAYSVNPALTVLRWRYGDQLEWRLVTIGLTERAEQYVERGYTPARSALGYMWFRRYGMPFTTEPRPRMVATAPACRAIVATRLSFPGREFEAFRALQFAWFTTPLVLDEEDQIAIALQRVPALDVETVIARLDDPEVTDAYEQDRVEARTAAGSATELQRKAAVTDGPVRYTAPSVIFMANGIRLEAGGFQTTEAYDVLVANLDPGLLRAEAPDDLLPVLERFPGGLTTQEVAAVMARGNLEPDRAAAEAALIELVASGAAKRTPVGDDALWSLRAPEAAAAPVPRAA